MNLKLKNDRGLRNRLMVPESMAHPAKGHLGLWEAIIEKYTQPGDVILDPMAGVGSTLIGALMGRDVVCVELEQHFIVPMLASWRKMQVVSPMLGHQMGRVVILRGDARCLPLGSADSIVTSPPYEGSVPAEDTFNERAAAAVKGGSYKGQRPDVWVSKGNIASQGFGKGYTRPSAIVTSPPYGHDSEHDQHLTSQMREPPGTSKTLPYSPDATNIGNLRSQAYWDAMRQVYAECHRVLRPQGIMVLVLKGFTRDG